MDGIWFILICNLLGYHLQFHKKKCNISNSGEQKEHYLQLCIKCNVRNTDEQKYISQMSAIDVYDTINHLKLK